MPRVDVWDIPEDKPTQPIWIGYRQGLTDKYDLGRKLGEGGFGSVRIVVQKSNGAEFACKSICKRLDVPNLPPIKQQQHLENIKREVLILRKLRGTLNVVHLAYVYEDETHVHIIMEYCRGGELFHKMGRRHYSERTVASYMRAVLRTLAQCHAQRILHRDIKPGNFMLLTEAEDSPLKAIDFGLAVFFDPAKLPRTDLGLEGTPWYMAPEVLSSCVEPASDVWAAGVMAYQLLSGRFPFDDWAHPEAPALSLVWRSILSESPSFKGSSWGEVSDAAKDFCRALLDKDALRRPSAREALGHPWLQKGNTRQRLQGTQLTQVVQRLQRHSQQNVFKKTVLDMMANELLARHTARAQQQAPQHHHNYQQQQEQPLPPPPLQQQQQQLPPHPPGTHAAAAAAAAASSPGGLRVLPGLPGASCVTPQYAEGSVHRRQQLLRLVPPKRSASLELSSGGGPQEAAALSGLAVGAGASSQDTTSSSAQQAGGQLVAWGAAGHGSAWAGLAGRLEGTWHGPGGTGAAGGSSPGAAGGWEGSVTGRRGLGSLRGATSALEALRRARERAAAASDGAAGTDGGVTQAAAAAAGGGASSSAGAGAGGGATADQGEGGSVRYKGPVKDPGTASLWDLQFMANRLAMEGSAHGNAYTQRLLQAASTHAGKTPAAVATLQAVAALASQPQQQQQQQPVPPGASAQQPGEHGASPAHIYSPPKQQPQQQQPQQAVVGSPQLAAASHRLEGTWHGPSRSSSINVASVARQAAHPGRAELERDLSWHGRTSHMRHLSEQGALAGSKQAGEHEEFLRFLEAAKRQRQEQRKVARLVLEGSTHGGVQYFLPARGTSSIAVALGAAAGPATSGPASLAEGDDGATDDDDDDTSTGAASKASRSPRPSTPGSSGHGSTAAAGFRDGGSGSAAGPARPGLLGKLKHSLKRMLSPEASRNGSSSDLNALARSSWRPGLATQDPVLGPAAEPNSATAAAAATAAATTAVAAAAPPPAAPTPTVAPAGGSANSLVVPAAGAAPGGAGPRAGAGGPHVQLAEQILGLQSPGWQASLESRRRGQGAYAALMAATSMATEAAGSGAAAGAAVATAGDAEGAGSRSSGEPAAPASQPAAMSARSQQAVRAAPQQQPVEQGSGARRVQRPAAAPLHVGPVAGPPAGQASEGPPGPGCGLEPGLTPLEQALRVQTQQQTKQQQDANSSMLLRPGSTTQQHQQQSTRVFEAAVQGVEGQQGLLPLPGQPQVQSLPAAPPPSATSWQPPSQDSMLPLPRSSQRQQQQQHQQQRVGADLLPTPGSSAHTGTAQRRVASPLVPQPSADTAAAAGAGSGDSSMLPGPGRRPAAAAAAQQEEQPHVVAPAVAAASRPVRAGDQDYAPFWTFGGAGGAERGAASILPTPGSSGTGLSQPGPQHTAAASPFAAGAAGMDSIAAPERLPPPAAATASGGGVAAACGTAPVSAAGRASAGPARPAPAAVPLPPLSPPASVSPSAGGGPVVPALAEVSRLLDLLAGSSPDMVTVEQLQAGLAGLGYLLEPSEVLELACSLGYGVEGAQGVPLSQLAASQLDWEELQVNHREEWLQCLRATFDAMDADRDGRLRPSEILEALKDKLPEAEVNAAIEDVLLEAAADEDEGLDFAAFKMLASLAADGSTPLDQYDARLAGSQEPGGSVHSQGAVLQLLHTVPEAEQ